MSEAKHTAGPWTSIGASVFTKDGDPCFEIVNGLHLTRSGTAEQRIADARLIAAAPEMLEALLDLTDLLDETHQDELKTDHFGDGPNSCSYCTSMNHARTIIRKATGEVA